jgi:hypothetical protein
LSDGIRHFRDKAQRLPQRAVSASLGALRHDNIGTNLDRVRNMPHVLALADNTGSQDGDLRKDQVMKPQPPPISPRPPALVTAAASAPPPARAIGAETMGWRILRVQVSRVESIVVQR